MLENSFSRFIRSGGNTEFVLDLRHASLATLERKEFRYDLGPAIQRFSEQLSAADETSRTFLRRHLNETNPALANSINDVSSDIQSYVNEFESRLSSVMAAYASSSSDQTSFDALIDSEVQTISEWLLRRFEGEINERRQRSLGVTHYIWRSRDDAKVRTAHTERDDRVFSWDHQFEDGPPGHGYGCRCIAEPAILDNTVILTTLPVQRGLSERIADAQSRGLARAGTDAAVGSATFLYQTLRASYLGYRRLFGGITPEEEQERLTMRTAVLDAVQSLTELDAETAALIAEEFVDYFDAQHAELRLLDLEYRLGLTSEEALLAAYEEVAYLDASVLLGGTAFTTGAAKLGVNLGRLRPRNALLALRSARTRLDDLIAARRLEVGRFVDQRFAELSAQGHGPARHEGAVTTQMLEDRVLRGFDPMTGTTTDALSGGRHGQVRVATRITSEADFVGAEAVMRRSPEYRAAREAALLDPRYRDGFFSVVLPIEDVLGSSYVQKVEGLRRLGSARNPIGVENVNFEGGSVRATFELSIDGEPKLITLFPEGA